ncbi:ABC transporter ATP-binding protein [Martelella alba]|uniref:ABC transporter ATP-binding protein n=1 Tax=Martelella alba TaxID=2590451 RepID=A0ABY2SK12_9HYPH|nr:ABC transporter ATP-binding protein [Martelella alba]TKI05285.1 ABC transporter ATP-binding protein [Martelella alba]
MRISGPMIGGELEILAVTHRFGHHKVIDNVTLRVQPGEILAILGPSGSGKTTLLNMVGGRLAPEQGDITLGGRSILGLPPDRIDTATVFQDYALFPHLNVRDNVGFGLRIRGLPKAQVAQEVERLLALVGLEDYGGRRIQQLSGGQRQRIATARALAVKPNVLLLDEPMGALDRQIRGRLQRELAELLRRLHMTTLIVTHDQDEAFAMADRIAIMRDGRLEQCDTPDTLYRCPETAFVATFLGQGTLLTGQVAPQSGVMGATSAALADSVSDGGGEQTYLVRPQHVEVASPGKLADATWRGACVRSARSFGAQTTLDIELSGGARLEAAHYGISPFSAGDHVDCRVAPEHFWRIPQP